MGFFMVKLWLYYGKIDKMAILQHLIPYLLRAHLDGKITLKIITDKVYGKGQDTDGLREINM